MLQVTVDPRIHPSLRTVWKKDEIPFEKGGRIYWSNEGLTIVNTEKKDEGIYTCEVHTEYDQVTSSGRLTVLNEAPTFTSTPIDIRVLEGRNTLLICQAAGIPQPIVKWKFKGKTLESKNTMAVVTNSLCHDETWKLKFETNGETVDRTFTR